MNVTGSGPCTKASAGGASVGASLAAAGASLAAAGASLAAAGAGALASLPAGAFASLSAFFFGAGASSLTSSLAAGSPGITTGVETSTGAFFSSYTALPAAVIPSGSFSTFSNFSLGGYHVVVHSSITGLTL